MKKIGLLISQLNYGGAERVVSRLTQILCDDYRVYLILFEDTFIMYEYSGELVNLNIKSVEGIAKLLLPFKRASVLRMIKQKLELDYVISFLDSPNVVNILSRTAKCKTGISIRNYSKMELNNSLLSNITSLCIRYLYKKADIVIPVSRVISESLEKDYEISRDRQKVIYNPFDVEQIQKLASEKLEPHYDKFIEKDSTFISVGRHMHQKGLWHLVKAFKVLHDICSKARLIIIGADYQDGKVKNLVEDLNLNGCVILAGQQNNPFKFMVCSSVYVLSSLFEGFPNAMVEAMACGCPVISADCKSGPREILYNATDLDRHANNIEFADYGLLVPALELEENWDPRVITEGEIKLANAMLLYLNDPELRDRYSRNALERAHYFSYEMCRKQFQEILS